MPHNRYLPTRHMPDPAMRLVALPYAGGGAAAYFRWQPAMPSGVEIVPICLPGRETRISEQPISNMGELVPQIANAIAPLLDRPYVLLGHSMGATLAFELAREVRRRNERAPSLLIVAASAAPHRPQVEEQLHNLPDAEFVDEMSRRFDGIPAAVRENEELLELLLPAMHADVKLLETYEYVEEPPLETDLLAIGGTEDRAVSATALADWRRHTASAFSNRLLPGGHFFMFPTAGRGGSQPPAAVRMIAERLARYVEP